MEMGWNDGVLERWNDEAAVVGSDARYWMLDAGHPDSV